jgi:hypothetical protein
MHPLQRSPLLLEIVPIAVVALIIVLVRASSWTGQTGRPEPWWSPEVSADGTHVTVSYTVGGCFRSEHTETAEGRDRVTITVLVSGDGGAACAESAQERTATVTLDEPLDDRELVDGATD